MAGGGRRRALLGSDEAVEATAPLVLAYVTADAAQLPTEGGTGAAAGLGAAAPAPAPFLHLVLTQDAILWAPCAAVHDLLHATGPHAVPIKRNDGRLPAETIFGRVGTLAALFATVVVRRVRDLITVQGSVADTMALYKELATAPLEPSRPRRATNITLRALVAIDVSAKAQTLMVNGPWSVPKLATLVCAPDVYDYVRDGAGSEASCGAAGIAASACGCAVYVTEMVDLGSGRAFGRLYVRFPCPHVYSLIRRFILERLNWVYAFAAAASILLCYVKASCLSACLP